MHTTVPELQIIKKVNQKLRRVTESLGCSFLNMEQVFNVTCSPKARPCFTSDGIHLSSYGYQVWAREISSHLHSLEKR